MTFPVIHRSRFLKARLFLTGLILLLSVSVNSQTAILEKILTIGRKHTTIYEALNILSAKAGCYFVYDSKVLNSERKVKLEADNESLKQVLDELFQDPELRYRVIGEHILIYREAKKTDPGITDPGLLPDPGIGQDLIVKGYVFDNSDKQAIPYVSIGIRQENIGTVTNADGCFVLKIPAADSNSVLMVSHLGYLSQEIPVRLLNRLNVKLYLDRRVISMQEVIIRYMDPKTIISRAIEQREVNNSLVPVYMTSFYREGVQKNNRYLSFSEAVFKVYKTAYNRSEESEQVKLLKSRKVQNIHATDTVMVKLKGGILSALQLDITRNLPGFMNEEEFGSYTFSYTDLISSDYRNAYAISFTQNETLNEPLYSGVLYIDRENYAVLGADFEINPKFLHLAADNLVLKKSRGLRVKLEKISYSVSYTSFNGRYYLSHVRCDLNLKTRMRNHLFYDNFNTFLELANCKIDTLNVVHFAREEVIRPNIIFSDVPFTYDDSFWGDYNVITPEEKLNAALSKIIPKIEEIK